MTAIKMDFKDFSFLSGRLLNLKTNNNKWISEAGMNNKKTEGIYLIVTFSSTLMSSLQTLKPYARGRPFAKKVNVYMSIIFVIGIIHILNTSCSVSGKKKCIFCDQRRVNILKVTFWRKGLPSELTVSSVSHIFTHRHSILPQVATSFQSLEFLSGR